MRVIIAGSRHLDSVDLDAIVAASGFDVTYVLSGGARGVDTLAIRWAERKGIPCRIHAAEWQRYGKKAGPLRNAEMARDADALVAVWDGKSRGTGNMIETAKAYGLKVYVSPAPEESSDGE